MVKLGPPKGHGPHGEVQKENSKVTVRYKIETTKKIIALLQESLNYKSLVAENADIPHETEMSSYMN